MNPLPLTLITQWIISFGRLLHSIERLSVSSMNKPPQQAITTTTSFLTLQLRKLCIHFYLLDAAFSCPLLLGPILVHCKEEPRLPTCLPPGSGPLTHLSIAEMSGHCVGNDDVGAHVFLHQVRVQGVVGMGCITGGTCRQERIEVRMESRMGSAPGPVSSNSLGVAHLPVHSTLTEPSPC